MFAFVLRHHGDKVPACKEGNTTIADSEANVTEMLSTLLPTLDMTTFEEHPTEYDDLTHGLTDDRGR